MTVQIMCLVRQPRASTAVVVDVAQFIYLLMSTGHQSPIVSCCSTEGVSLAQALCSLSLCDLLFKVHIIYSYAVQATKCKNWCEHAQIAYKCLLVAATV